MNIIPYCGYCGAKVSVFAQRCPQCTSWLVDPPKEQVQEEIQNNVPTPRMPIMESAVGGMLVGAFAGLGYAFMHMNQLGFWHGFGVIMEWMAWGTGIGAVLGIFTKK